MIIDVYLGEDLDVANGGLVLERAFKRGFWGTCTPEKNVGQQTDSAAPGKTKQICQMSNSE